MINLIVALRDDVVVEMAGELDDSKATAKASILSHPDVQHVLDAYPRYHDGSNEWTAFSMYVTPSAEISGWFQMYTGKALALGAWNMDGTQYGTAIDEGGEVVGNPAFPVDPMLIKFMPDDVVYDENGLEVSRTPSDALKQVNLLAGQKSRMYA